jgi:hypothetical protein
MINTINMINNPAQMEGVRPLVPRLQRLLNQARKCSVTVVFSSLALCGQWESSGRPVLRVRRLGVFHTTVVPALTVSFSGT